MATFPTYSEYPVHPGYPGHLAHLGHPAPGDQGPMLSYDFSAYSFDVNNSPPPPPPPPAEQPTFSSDCDNLSQFLSQWANPSFSNDENYNYTAPPPTLSLGPQHTSNWLVAHATHYAPLGASEPLMQHWTQSLSFEPISPSHLMEPTMSNSLQADDPEVLAAASTLSRTTAMEPATNFPLGPMTTGPSTLPEPGYHFHGHGHSPGGYMPPGSRSTPRHNAGFPGVLDHSRPGPPFTPAPSRHVEAQYGSDSCFSQQQFQPRSHEDSLNDIHSRQTAILSCLTRNESATPSRVPSPVEQGRFVPASGPPALFLQTRPNSARRRETSHDDDEEPLGKRRKSSLVKAESPVDEAAVGDMLAGPSPTMPTEKQQRRRQSSAQATKTGTASTTKRKRASTTVPKRNLTETERRNNHIESEARRRNQVTDAFGSLRTLVPGIEKGKGLSRNTVLTAIGDWLVYLKGGNERLQALLDGPPPPP